MRELETLLLSALEEEGPLVFLTGAGISAESGIPTFRGKEGFWTVGSKVYQPQEMATFAMFHSHPEEVWKWYLMRREMCLEAEPNPAHLALVEIEKRWGDRFRLITQNVDGLHIRAGNSPERTWRIHGDINFVRCVVSCTTDVLPIPENTDDMHCKKCGDWLRPHVLWFDEYYNEEWYRYESSIAAASESALLVVIGTSGATNLPIQVGMQVAERGACLVDVNPEPNPFSELAQRCEKGTAISGKASESLPRIAEILLRS
jgi:NAD-dependent deacetylase